MPMEFSLATEISQLLTQCLAPMPRPAHKRFVWFVGGILLAQSIVLRRMAVAQVRRGGDSLRVASHERRLRRLLNDARVTWAQPMPRPCAVWCAGNQRSRSICWWMRADIPTTTVC